MVRTAKLGTDRRADGPTHGGHTAHCDEVARASGLPEGNHITAAAPSVMEGDGAVRVDQLLQLMDDTVPVGRGLRVGEARHPLGLGFLVARADLINDFLLDAAAAGADALADGVDDGAEGQLGVREHREIDLVGLVDVSGIGIDVDDADAGRDWPAVGAVGLAEGVSDGEDHIGFAIDLDGGAGGVTAAGVDAAAEGERVIFWEDALAHNGSGDGHGEQFGELADFISGAGAHGATPGVEDWEARADQHICGALDFGIGGAGLAGGTYRGVGENRLVGLGGEDVLVHFQHHRSGGPGTERGEGAAHNLGDVLDAGEGAAPLAQAVEDAGGDLLLPLLAEVPQRVLTHKEQHGNVVGIATGDAGEAVGGARPGAGHGDADLTRGAGVAVGNLNAEALVAGGKGPYRGGAQGAPEGGESTAGKTGYVTYSFLF